MDRASEISLQNDEAKNSSEKSAESEMEEEKKEYRTDWEYTLFLIGFVLCVIPAFIIALSSRYQSELIMGIGYLPVYLQYFGAVCCITSIFFFF